MERLPTTDLYFRWACRNWIARPWRRGPVRQVGANTFVCGDTLLLVRRDDDALMERALGWPGRFVYLIDDDIAAARDSPELPPDYRGRLMEFDERHHQRLLARADTLVVPSARLERQLAGLAPLVRIHPFWRYPPADARHFRESRQRFRMVFLGSGSHAGALLTIAPVIRRVVERYTHIEFSYFGKTDGIPALCGHPRIHRLRPMRWPRYARWLAKQRFHLALYPMSPSPFDQARSANKIAEHAIVGAAAIYPADWAEARRLAPAALFAGSEDADWEEQIERAVESNHRSQLYPQYDADQLAHLFDSNMQNSLWRDILGIFT